MLKWTVRIVVVLRYGVVNHADASRIDIHVRTVALKDHKHGRENNGKGSNYTEDNA